MKLSFLKKVDTKISFIEQLFMLLRAFETNMTCRIRSMNGKERHYFTRYS